MYATFGQELYVKETVRAAGLLASASPDERIAARVANGLPHQSRSMRRRLASKMLQRLGSGGSTDPLREAFPGLIAGAEDSATRRELVYYAAARTDRLVESIAQEILYPYFIDRRIPKGVSEAELAAHNVNLLIELDPILTLPFIAWYAETLWGFRSVRTVALSLRILRQAGILLASPVMHGRKRTRGYTLAPHGLTPATFIWCLYDEFGQESVGPTADQVERSDFARTFVAPPGVISACLADAVRAGFAKFEANGTRRVSLPLGPEEMAAALTSNQ